MKNLDIQLFEFAHRPPQYQFLLTSPVNEEIINFKTLSLDSNLFAVSSFEEFLNDMDTFSLSINGRYYDNFLTTLFAQSSVVYCQNLELGYSSFIQKYADKIEMLTLHFDGGNDATYTFVIQHLLPNLHHLKTLRIIGMDECDDISCSSRLLQLFDAIPCPQQLISMQLAFKGLKMFDMDIHALNTFISKLDHLKYFSTEARYIDENIQDAICMSLAKCSVLESAEFEFSTCNQSITHISNILENKNLKAFTMKIEGDSQGRFTQRGEENRPIHEEFTILANRIGQHPSLEKVHLDLFLDDYGCYMTSAFALGIMNNKNQISAILFKYIKPMFVNRRLVDIALNIDNPRDIYRFNGLVKHHMQMNNKLKTEGQAIVSKLTPYLNLYKKSICDGQIIPPFLENIHRADSILLQFCIFYPTQAPEIFEILKRTLMSRVLPLKMHTQLRNEVFDYLDKDSMTNLNRLAGGLFRNMELDKTITTLHKLGL